VSEKPTLRERAQTRWRNSGPDAELTWGRELSGDEFVAMAAAREVFRPETSILEIGPGYGRILRSILEAGLPFAEYLAVDISQQNVDFLRRTFDVPRVEFTHGDIESISLERTFDLVLSSLTFKHFYPSFEAALVNIKRHLAPGGMLFFDLPEGQRREFRSEDVGYLRHYTRPQVEEILPRASFELVGFDHVKHDGEHVRLLVIAKPRPDAP
jgi:SAM-dependent methyltransferase